jgi:alpha-ketoglutarate-dependent taurine dioxygenase
LTETEVRQRKMETRKRKESGFKRLMNLKPKAVSVEGESLVSTGYLNDHSSLPLVVRPAFGDVSLPEWSRSNREFIEKHLFDYGAILLRDFKVESVGEFEAFAQAVCDNLFDGNGELPRTNISGSIYTPVDYPSDKRILWHSENTFCPRWPMKIAFYCIQPAQMGGETPIVDSRKVFQLVAPEIRDEFARKNVMYVRNYDNALGLNWQTVFQTTSRSEVEAYCRANAIEFEWKGVDHLRTRSVCAAVAAHPRTGEMVWFNQATHWHVSCLESEVGESLIPLFGEEGLPRNIYYGDGSTIPNDVMKGICDVYRKTEVCFAWQTGDIMLLDNMLTSHARNPYRGPRRIAVAMGDMIGAGDLQLT